MVPTTTSMKCDPVIILLTLVHQVNPVLCLVNYLIYQSLNFKTLSLLSVVDYVKYFINRKLTVLLFKDASIKQSKDSHRTLFFLHIGYIKTKNII